MRMRDSQSAYLLICTSKQKYRALSDWPVMHLNSEMAGGAELEEADIFLSAFSF